MPTGKGKGKMRRNMTVTVTVRRAPRASHPTDAQVRTVVREALNLGLAHLFDGDDGGYGLTIGRVYVGPSRPGV